MIDPSRTVEERRAYIEHQLFAVCNAVVTPARVRYLIALEDELSRLETGGQYVDNCNDCKGFDDGYVITLQRLVSTTLWTCQPICGPSVDTDGNVDIQAKVASGTL